MFWTALPCGLHQRGHAGEMPGDGAEAVAARPSAPPAFGGQPPAPASQQQPPSTTGREEHHHDFPFEDSSAFEVCAGKGRGENGWCPRVSGHPRAVR